MKIGFVKYLVTSVLSLTLIITFMACEPQEILINEIEFFIAKEWKMDKYYFNGELKEDGDMDAGDQITTYRLKLNDDFTFTRTYFDGTVEGGEWALTAGLSQLILFVNDPREENYLLLNLEVRQLEIRLLQEIKNNQNGQWDIRYILVPIKGQ